MQKFSEFVNDYKSWKVSHGKKAEISPKEVKRIREAYEAMASKKPAKLEESKEDFDSVLSKYREWKEANHGTRAVTLKEKENLKKALAEKLNESKEAPESKEALKESSEKCPCCGSDVAKLYKVKAYLDNEDISDVEAKDIVEALNKDGYVEDLKEDEKICEDCIQNGLDKVMSKNCDCEDGKCTCDEEDEEIFDESIEGFKTLVTKYREWKKETHGTARLNEKEKELLKEKFLEKCSKLNESKKEAPKSARLTEAIAQYKEWKKAEHNSDEVTSFEEATIAKNLVLDDIQAKLDEAKKLVESGKKHLTEGDVMDAGADANAAAGAVADAGAMAADPALGGDPNAMGADPNAVGAALPQNIVDEISQIKTSIDALATECGIESPVDLGADAGAGVPAVTGAADPTMDATQADPNAAPAPDAGAAPMPESIKSVKARIAARNKAIKETVNYSNTKMVDGGKDAIKTPSTQELVNGTGNISANVKKAEWPIEPGTDKEPKSTKTLKNIEESMDEQAELAKKCLDENSEFSWSAYTKMLKNM